MIKNMEVRYVTTEVVAQILSMRPQSIRKRFAQTGSYFGMRPSKLPNGKLRWPADAVQDFLNNGGGK